MNRWQWLDVTKGIGIMLVVAGHVLRGLVSGGQLDRSEAYVLVDSIIYSFHMPLFFFLSGILFFPTLTRKAVPEAVLGKIDTILYPYIVWSIGQGAVELLLTGYTNNGVGSLDFLNLWHPRAHFWFLYYLFFFFLFSSLLFYAAKANKVAWIILLIASIGLYFIPTDRLPSWLRPFCSGYFFFTLGVIVPPALFAKCRGAPWAILSIVIFAISQFWFHAILNQNFTDKSAYLFAISTICVACTALLSANLLGPLAKIFAYLGERSMSIYLAHVLFGSGARVILTKFFGENSSGLHISAGIVLGVTGPVLLHNFVAKFSIPFVFSAGLTNRATRKSNQDAQGADV